MPVALPRNKRLGSMFVGILLGVLAFAKLPPIWDRLSATIKMMRVG